MVDEPEADQQALVQKREQNRPGSQSAPVPTRPPPSEHAHLVPDERERGGEAEPDGEADDLGDEGVEAGEHEHAAEERAADVARGEDRRRVPADNERRAAEVGVDRHLFDRPAGEDRLRGT